ncbi:hypothetical protein AA313_de0204119 [Arthrobotrys entomopaga]|nr:hypothetical protein AA313_de0204119 [Arthrobotrys entomopaga]
MATNPTITFLTLPPELRNQIYKYLLIFNIPPLPPPPHHLSYYIDIPTPSLHVSILRVNRQIHDEASRILYSYNVFPVRVKTMGGSFRDWDDSLVFYDVTYQTFWETVQYRNTPPWDKPPKYYHDTQHGSFPFTRISSASEISIPPFERYRHLLRWFHIAIIDLSVSAASKSFNNNNNNNNNNPPSPHSNNKVEEKKEGEGEGEEVKYRKLSRSILMPFITTRLKPLLYDHNNTQNSTASANIELYPKFLHPTPSKPGPMPYESFNEQVIKCINPAVFKELAYLVHPLTTLPWTWNITLQHPAGERFEVYKKDAWAECDADEGWSEAEVGRFGERELEVGYSWAMEEGKLVAVGEWERFPRRGERCVYNPVNPLVGFG